MNFYLKYLNYHFKVLIILDGKKKRKIEEKIDKRIVHEDESQTNIPASFPGFV